MTRFETAAALWAVIGASACSTQVSPVGDGPLAAEVAAFFERQVRAQCTQADRCAGAAFARSNYASAAVCEAYNRGGAQPRFGRAVAERVAAGTVRYDPSAAARCLEARERGCPFGDPLACHEVFVGTRVDGASCAHSMECARGLYCQFAERSAAVCAGHCRPRDVAPGERYMENEARCAAELGAHPSRDSSTARCVSLREGPPAGEGERCGNLEERPGHQLRRDCSFGLSCVRAAAGAEWRCARVTPPGSACGEGAPCAPGTQCLRAEDGVSRCITTGWLTRVEGGPCTSIRTPDEPHRCDPLLRLRCTDEGRCVRVASEGHEGEWCAGVFVSAGLCNEGLYCDSTTDGTCRRMLPLGAECGSGDSCLDGPCVAGRCSTSCL